MVCSKIALGVPTALNFDFCLKMRLLYRACCLLSCRCGDVLVGREKTVFSDPCIDDTVFDCPGLRSAKSGGRLLPSAVFFCGMESFWSELVFGMKKMYGSVTPTFSSDVPAAGDIGAAE